MGSDRPAAGEITHPAPVIRRRARNLDEELLEWWRSAPAGLDDESLEQVLVVLQKCRRSPSVADYYREHLAAVH